MRHLAPLLFVLLLGCDATGPSGLSGKDGQQTAPEASSSAANESEAAAGGRAQNSLPMLVGGTRLVPVDEAASDPAFSAFRQRLHQIIDRRDASALREVLAPRIHYSFGGGDPSPEGFFEHWSRVSTDLWTELDEVLSLGGKFDERGGVRRFVAPYVYAAWPEAIDPFTHVAAICDETIVRAAPGDDAEATSRLDHHIVELVSDDRFNDPDSSWRKIRMPDGGEGYVASECVRSEIDYRAGFERIEGEWRMTFFVAGD
jgi:hypothetical protein